MKEKIIAALMAVGMVTCISSVVYATMDTPDIIDTREYTVKSGDTLWEIAERYGDNDIDVRETIHHIRELSNCGSDIKPGQRLIIPVYED